MGNAAYRQTTANPNMDQDLKTFMQSDLPRFVWQDKIGNGKFMKSFVMRVESTELVVKVYMKLADEDLQQAASKLTNLWKVLSPTKFPSLMPYQMWIRSTARVKTPNIPVYLIRQYFSTNLSDRLSTRPFLNELEKYWIIFQLFKSLEICHENKIIHGDIKPENIMCTTSNWVVLTDFAPFKPIFIPDDDPTDFQFYFDTMARHKCYLAPERFYRKDVSKGGKGLGTMMPTTTPPTAGNTAKIRSRSLQTTGTTNGASESPFLPAVDVFSLGCVIAEVLLDGNSLFDLPSMLQYISSPTEGLSSTSAANAREEEEKTKSDFDENPARQVLSRIKNPLIRAVILDMTQKDPEKRLSASDYLKILFGNVERFHDSYGYAFSSLAQSIIEGPDAAKPSQTSNKAPSSVFYSPFPSYFETCIYPLYLKLHWNGVTPDDRIVIICETYDHLMEKITGDIDLEGSQFFALSLENSGRLLASALTLDVRNQSSLLLPAVSQQLGVSSEEDSSGSLYSKMKPELLQTARLQRPVDTQQEPSTTAVNDALEMAKARLQKLQSGNSSSPIAAANPSSLKTQAIQEMFSHTKSKDFFKVSLDSGHRRPVHEGLVLIVDQLCSNYRHLKYLTSRITCLMLLGRIGRLCADSVILQRIVPFLLVALEDSYSLIKITSLRIISALTSIVEEFDPIEVNFFPQYIFPNLGRIARDNELIVRIAFAECMGTLALTAKHFLDRGQSIFLHKAVADALANNQDINKIAIEFPYDQKLELLRDQVARWIRDIVVDVSSTANSTFYKSQKLGGGTAAPVPTSSPTSADSAVKKVILQHIMELCAFFGQESTMEKLLTQLLTFPNDQDWELRCAFCMKIPTVAAFLGATVTSEYIVPCLENTIYDVEEKVSLSTIIAITSLIQMRLISKYLIADFAQKCKSLLIHSSKTIRAATIELFVVACHAVGDITTAVSILPEIEKILRYPLLPSAITSENLRLSLASPLSRERIRQALWFKLREQAGSSNINLSELLYSAVPLIEESKEILLEERKEGISEDDRILFISPYLASSAREIFNKSLRWRASVGPRNAASKSLYSNTISQGKSSNLSGPLTSAEQRFNNGLLWTSLSSLENNVFCFQIPHIRSATYLADDWRKQSIFLDIDEAKNQQKIRYFFMGFPARGLDFAHRSLVVNSGDASSYSDEAYLSSTAPAVSGSAAAGAFAASKSFAQSSTEMTSTANNMLSATYSNSAFRFATSFGTNSISLLRRLKALEVPPLPVEMGSLLSTEEKIDVSDASLAHESVVSKTWRPKEGVLMMTLREHRSAVNRLVVSPDQSYFASASSDRTVRIWQTRQLDRLNFFRSCAVYTGHRGPISDAAVIDGTHSIATASKDGSVHVWRVDMQSNAKTLPDASNSAPTVEAASALPRSSAFVSGSSLIRSVNSGEGEILSVQHFNSDIASVVTFATQRGGIHGWDVRMPKEAFNFSVRPELGYVTSMTVSPERNFICTGTSKGYLNLWDVRYNLMTQAWRHSSCSSIQRLASGKAIRSATQNLSGLPTADGAYLFVAAGDNEAAVFGLPDGGECLKCFRSLSLDDNKAPIAALPRLEELNLPRHPASPLPSSFFTADKIVNSYQYSVKAMLGRVSPNNSSHLITAGTDRHIRFWDFRSPESCYTVAGLELTQLKSIYRRLDEKSVGKLFVCYTPTIPASDKILQSHLPVREGRGLSSPSVNFKDAVLDLKDIDNPTKFLLAGSRDGEIKIWR